MLSEKTLKDYAEAAASGSETPGGGSVSAYCGVLGSCMASMAANFTLGKKKYAEVEGEIREILEALAPLRERMLAAVDADAEAFEKIGAVYAMPKGTEEEKAARTEAMQAALKGGMDVPLGVMRAAVDALEMLPRLARIGNTNLITDTGVAAIVLAAAVEAAHLNVAINLKFIKDEALCNAVADEARELINRAQALSLQARTMVLETLAQ